MHCPLVLPGIWQWLLYMASWSVSQFVQTTTASDGEQEDEENADNTPVTTHQDVPRP